MSEPNADVPPRFIDEPGRPRTLVIDEREWLVRPDIWGLEFLPNEVRWRRERLFECHLRDRLTEHVRCDLCRPRIADLFGEYDETPFIDGEVWDIRDWYAATHPQGPTICDGHAVLKRGTQFQRGIVCPAEARDGVLDALLDLLHSAPHTPDRIEARAALHDWRRGLVFDLVGPNPFRPLAFDGAWRSDTAVSIAKGMYESRDFGAMPILADSLQDAGCDSDAVLTHCRDPQQVHVRGCWVVDLLLGKA